MTVDAIPQPREASGVRPLDRETLERGIRRRYAAERRFKAYGVIAISIGLAFLPVLFSSIFVKGYSAFLQTSIKANVFLDPAVIDPSGKRAENDLMIADYGVLAQDAIAKALGLDPNSRADARVIAGLLSQNADVEIRDYALKHQGDIGKTSPMQILVHNNVDQAIKAGAFWRRSASCPTGAPPARTFSSLIRNRTLRHNGFRSVRPI